jgi:chromosome segregation ATPase
VTLTHAQAINQIHSARRAIARSLKEIERLRAVEAENERLKEQLATIEEEGTESLNALPDCLMKLAPALVRVDELEAKLAKAVEALRELIDHTHNCEKELTEKLHNVDFCGESMPLTSARATIAAIKGETE